MSYPEYDYDLSDDVYDWRNAVYVACRDRIEPATPGSGISLDPFTYEDVARVVAARAGENDGDSWCAVFELKDGRYATVVSWCDYTGWGCQDGGEARIAATEEEAINFGLDGGHRSILGFK